MDDRLAGVLISSSMPVWLLNNGGSVSSALHIQSARFFYEVNTNLFTFEL